MEAAAVSKRHGYSLENDLTPILEGEVDLPNFKAEPIDRVVNNVAAVGHGLLARWGWARHEGRKQWAMFFLSPSAMGNANHGSFDGGGYVMIYSGRAPITGRFAICEHEKKDAAGADHRRGWHPGQCTKCGLDMTVDSSD